MNELETTRRSYADARGAKAYMDKEALVADERNPNAWALLERVGKPETAVDLGCGFGRDVVEMRRRGIAAVGVDASTVLLEEARKAGAEDWWVEADILMLEQLPQGQVDLVWSVASLVHVPRGEMPELLRRWWGWLKAGGYMVLVTKEGEGKRMAGNLGEGLERLMVFYSMDEFLAVLRPLGAEIMWQEHGATAKFLPTGDSLMKLIIRKP